MFNQIRRMLGVPEVPGLAGDPITVPFPTGSSQVIFDRVADVGRVKTAVAMALGPDEVAMVEMTVTVQPGLAAEISPGDMVEIDGGRYQVTEVRNAQEITVLGDLSGVVPMLETVKITRAAPVETSKPEELMDLGSIDEEAGW